MLTTSAAEGRPDGLPGQVDTVDDGKASPASSLTPRQSQALYLAAMGLSYKEAAALMVISVQSYKNLMQGAFLRLGVNSTIQAMNACGWGPR